MSLGPFSNLFKYTGPSDRDPFGGTAMVSYFESVGDLGEYSESLKEAADTERELAAFLRQYATLPPMPGDDLLELFPMFLVPVNDQYQDRTLFGRSPVEIFASSRTTTE